MNTIIKELIDEMIQYRKERKPIRYLQKAFDEMGDAEIYFPIGYLLSWHKGYFFGAEKPDKFEIGEIGSKRYGILFENCQELKKIFSVHKDHIGWSSNLSEEEQDEIRNYIHENYTVQIRIRRDARLNKD
ncbi:hypothetical protein BN1195_00299 [Chryseobacterium oranimense G311]|uniref:hypothetical protein n=1 Tax=Chryseobacterium oranimense TaxID=421058 RepID=UPI000533722D|nr:hypothetical protein [Chryseobacterium oranimense]CEJ68017.1 hypothetical protein BN1195_00299 [Chryseobacterium oranimense G311]